MVDLHADFFLRAISTYWDAPKACWRVFRRATRHDVTVPRLLLVRVVRDLFGDSKRRA